MKLEQPETPAKQVWVPVSDLPSALYAWEELRKRDLSTLQESDDTDQDNI